MAQTGFTPISIYYSSTSTNVPTAGNLVAGELAINTADGKLFYKDSAGVVQVIGTKGGVGSSTTTQVLYNTSGLVVGSANMTFNGTALTLANDASISGLTVGKGGGAVSLNTVVGSGALQANTTGTVNNAFGSLSLQANTSGTGNNAFGRSSLYTNTTGTYNSAFGHEALYSTTTGSFNTAIGTSALTLNTTASNNTAVGYQAGYSNTTGNSLTALGYQALYNYNGSGLSVGIGYRALYSATNPTASTAIGYQCLWNNTTGDANTAIGREALQSNTTASNNTAVGYQAGSNITTGSYNVYIGNATSASSVSAQAEIVIAGSTGTTGKGTNTGFIQAGGGGVYQGNNSSSWSVTSDQRLKKNIVDNNTGLDIISNIQIRNFEYRLPEEVTELDPTCAIERSGVQLGVIAQEIQQVSQEFVKEESTGVLSVDSDNLTWYLVNAVKELNAKVIELEAKLNAK